MSSTVQSVKDDLFYFESDHLALRNNKDYSDVLKTIFVLDAQRTRAIQDYDIVVDLHKTALEDPVAFINKFKNGEELGVPLMQTIAEIPNINWSSYKVDIPTEGLDFLNENKLLLERDNSNYSNAEPINNEENKTINVRPWTVEEQKRLEELLVIYPPEDIEIRRFKKIATALGTRTVKQVSSRLQKYFLKLYKAGLPIPGRIPKSFHKRYTFKKHLHHRHNHYLWKPSTFFPQLNIPVSMNEKEEIPGPSSSAETNNENANYLLPSSSEIDNDPYFDENEAEEKSELEMQLSLLYMVKRDKETEDLHQNFEHQGFKCDYCGDDPITGTRWHCTTCKIQSVDFCTDCLVSQLYSENPHSLSHKFTAMKYSETSQNVDYGDTSSDSFSNGNVLGNHYEENLVSTSSENSGNEEDVEERLNFEINMDQIIQKN